MINEVSPAVIEILDRPIFIVGCPRSGTTWLQRLIVSHPEICGGPESGFFNQFWSVTANLTWNPENRRDMWLLAYWQKDQLQKRIYELWIETFADFVAREKAHFFCEKSPSHALRISDIHNLLPRARFIHIIRDSRSSSASLLAAGRGWGKSWAPRNAKDAAVLWYLHVKEARKQGLALGDDFYTEVHYEDLKQNTEIELQRLFTFIGVQFSPDFLKQISEEQNFDKQKEIGGSKFKAGLQKSEPQGFFRKGEIDSWKKDLSWLEQATIWRYTRKLMTECGYSWGGRK